MRVESAFVTLIIGSCDVEK